MSKDLVEAAKNGNLDRVSYNVNHLGVPIDSRHPPTEGPTALYWAACNGYEKICDWLIRHKADPNVILPSSGSTPLHAAADRGHYNCVLCLISSTFLLKVSKSQFSPRKSTDLCRKIEKNRPKIETIHLYKNSQAKETYSYIRLRKCVNDCEANGSEVNRQTTNNGDTALHLAAYRNYPSISRLLLEHGASLMLVNKQDRTPLDEACLKNNVEVIQLLTKKLGMKHQKIIINIDKSQKRYTNPKTDKSHNAFQNESQNLRQISNQIPKHLTGSSKNNRSFYNSDDRIGIQPFDIGPEQTQSTLSELHRYQVFDDYETTSLTSCSFNNFTPSSQGRRNSKSSKPLKNLTPSERIAELESLVETLTEDVTNKNFYISSLRRENENLKKKLGLHDDFKLNKS
ncbi:hypothetical protein HELRODRAFT_191529 [Helobdella robusta]|uniref:Uncharacterized protein n=1 Tax=Helobdella robusta TaxID=6412 RepID=T1FT23_HELRO|nr:hypothetical protein HELRODRAFT_191529 [Helobdella robusta]ESO04970.1 hypothetical protein HELRODRAFT_191529 [Helobdella robusta]